MTQHTYFCGALAGRDFLDQWQRDLREQRIFRPVVLRWEIEHSLHVHGRAYAAGFLDAVAAYLLIALEGCLLEPRAWNVLEDLDWRLANSGPA